MAPKDTIRTEIVENVAVIQTSESSSMDDTVPVETRETHGDTTAKVVNPRDKVVTDDTVETGIAVEATDELSCDLCDFISKSRNGLAIHMTRKHSTIEQLDGNVDIDSDLRVNDLVKIDGEYKDPSFRPWSSVDPEKEVKVLWGKLEDSGKIMGLEEIGEGSTCFEHHFEFWGTWRVNKEGITDEFLKNAENWPKGVKITYVKPA